MANIDLGNNIVLREDHIKRTWLRSMKANKSFEKKKKKFRSEKVSRSLEVVFSFPATWSVKDWFFNATAFGQVEADLEVLGSLKRIGLKKTAAVNEAYFQRFIVNFLSNRKFKEEESHFGFSYMKVSQAFSVFTVKSLQ